MRRADDLRSLRADRLGSAVAAMMIACLAILALAPAAEAGTWRGGVSHKGSPASGATVSVCGQSVTTNNSGRFSVEVPGGAKKCSIVVTYQGRQSTPVKADLKPYLSLSLRNGPQGWVIQIQ